ncbi:MAG: hypothetical protein ACI86M_004049 [Saprospiraceae bacterium]
MYHAFLLRIKHLQGAKVSLEKEVTNRTKELSSINHQMLDSLATLRKTESKLTSAVIVKNRLLGIVSHEIIGSIKMINITSEIIYDKRDSLDLSDIYSSLKEIKSTSQVTMTVLHQILTWI